MHIFEYIVPVVFALSLLPNSNAENAFTIPTPSFALQASPQFSIPPEESNIPIPNAMGMPTLGHIVSNLQPILNETNAFKNTIIRLKNLQNSAKRFILRLFPNSNAENAYTTPSLDLQELPQYTSPPEKNYFPNFVGISRLDRIVSNLQAVFENTDSFKNTIIENINATIKEVWQNNTKQEQVNIIIYKNRLQNFVLRTPESDPNSCIQGNSDYQGPFKVRNLALLKCSDEASRLLSINSQWKMIENYKNQIHFRAMNSIKSCKTSELQELKDICFVQTLDQYERSAAGVETMLYDFVKYIKKIKKRVVERFSSCYSKIDVQILTKFIVCLRSNKIDYVNKEMDLERKFKAVQDLSGSTKDNRELNQLSHDTLYERPLRRRHNH